MAVKTLQITQTASAVQFAAVATYARWVRIQNNAAHVCRVGDAATSASVGISLAASNAVNSELTMEPMPNGCHYDLSQWYTVGTNTDKLDVLYDSMT